MECVICREIVVGTAQIYPCGHYYCESCSQQVFSAPQPSCPTCRARVSQAQVFRVAVTAAAQSAGAHAGEGGAAAAGGEVDASDSDLLRTKVSGQFGTKIEGLVRRLLLLKARQPQDKSLVFSQWPDALKLVSAASVALLLAAPLPCSGRRHWHSPF